MISLEEVSPAALLEAEGAAEEVLMALADEEAVLVLEAAMNDEAALVDDPLTDEEAILVEVETATDDEAALVDVTLAEEDATLDVENLADDGAAMLDETMADDAGTVVAMAEDETEAIEAGVTAESETLVEVVASAEVAATALEV